MNSCKKMPGDRALGMDSSITRRDFLGTTLLASGAALLDGFAPSQLLAARARNANATAASEWNGYGGIGDYASSNGNTWAVLTAGHMLRDCSYEKCFASSAETGETYDCVIVGGGISGLAAALFFLRQAGPKATCLVLDDHAIFGGEAKQNDFEVDGQRLTAHQGSAIYFVPYARSFLAKFYESIGLKEPRLEYQRWGGPGLEMTIGRTPYDSAGMSTGQYGFWFGTQFGRKAGVWQTDPVTRKFADAPVSEATRREMLRWFLEVLRKRRRSILRNTKGMASRAIWIQSRSKSTTFGSMACHASSSEHFFLRIWVADPAWARTHFPRTATMPQNCCIHMKRREKRYRCFREGTRPSRD